tara:strand:- start:142 stop:780 length:639 start_codon:yes stop_codon:yes gene_type:complete
MGASHIEIPRKGMMFVLSSPSGAGKTTISKALIEQNCDITMSISVTTRRKRPGEKDGKDYFFVDQSRFDQMIEQGDFLEYATVFNESYGTPRKLVEKKLSEGIDVLFDVDWQGTQLLKQQARGNLVCVFILPPSLSILEKRLQKRAQDSENVVKNRMEKAKSELSHWDEYDYVIVNQDIDLSIKQVGSILIAERLRRTRRFGLENFISNLYL